MTVLLSPPAATIQRRLGTEAVTTSRDLVSYADRLPIPPVRRPDGDRPTTIHDDP